MLMVGIGVFFALWGRDGAVSASALRQVRKLVVAIWLLAMGLAPFVEDGAGVHLFWAAQLPLVTLYLGSGLLVTPDPSTAEAREIRSGVSSWKGQLLYFTMSLTLGLMPLLLISWFPGRYCPDPTFREFGPPMESLGELARWGLRGDLPGFLEPRTNPALKRGVDYLPRAITVPFGTSLLAAWFWIFFGVATVCARSMPSSLTRRKFSLLAAPVVCFFLVGGSALGLALGPLETQLFMPVDVRTSGIWTSDPFVMKSYGPVLVIALFMACLMLFLELREGRRE
jgi:hypothetical protein